MRRIQPERFAISLNGQVFFPHVPIDNAQVVVTLDARGIELKAAAQTGDSVVEALQEVLHRSEIDERTGPQRIETSDLLEMVSGAGQLVGLEEDGCQAVMNIRVVGTEPEGLNVELLGLVPFALGDGLAGLRKQLLKCVVSRSHE